MKRKFEEMLVEVQEDHLKALTSANPVKAIEELIYNALDADATLVEIIFEPNAIGGIAKIIVKDNGFGIHEDNKKYFKGLGGSWKRNVKHTPRYKRIIHGKYGKGRFKAFALGDIVYWKTCYEINGKFLNWEIIGDSCKDIRIFQISPATPSKDTHGTTVIIENITEKAKNIKKSATRDSLTSELALYLINYSNIKIIYDGIPIDSQKYIIGNKEYKIPIVYNNEEILCDIIVLEWSIHTEKAIYFCDESGFVLDKREMRISTFGFNISVYIKSKSLAKYFADVDLSIWEFDPKLNKIIDAGKFCVREYCRAKIVREGQDIIETWKNEDVYPYTEPTNNKVEEIERQVFDVVALNINEHLPSFETFDRIAKKLSLTLVKSALERGPRELRKILEGIINLPKDSINDLNQLLEHTTLSDIIAASKAVADRLNFLTGLESIIFDHKAHTKERSQLHKLLENNTWIFGEEYNMSLSDKSLDRVLATHLQSLRPSTRKNSKSVLREGGKRGIIDMMLSRRIPESNPSEHTHLIIELKRPSQKIDQKVMSQVISYATAVMKDERFNSVKAKWYFWAVSNEITDEVNLMATGKGTPDGLYKDGENFQIWVMPWSKVLDNCKSRLHFFQQELKFENSAEQSIDYLRSIYSNYIPELDAPMSSNDSE
ncbi:MAG: hypothetical protein HDQ92_02425 [Desulfovibrio sp.]|nr:hypothetical protein [Desulfovibrio sp.]